MVDSNGGDYQADGNLQKSRPAKKFGLTLENDGVS
jgi:hypothetical protein